MIYDSGRRIMKVQFGRGVFDLEASGDELVRLVLRRGAVTPFSGVLTECSAQHGMRSSPCFLHASHLRR